MKLKMIVLIPIAALITTSLALFVGHPLKIFGADHDIQELTFPEPYRDLVDVIYEKDKKIVYFSYILKNSVNLALYNYKTSTIEKLEVDANVNCLDMDSATKTIYIGTDKGLKSIMLKHTRTAIQLYVEDKNITSVYFKDELLYYVIKKDGAFTYKTTSGDSVPYGGLPKGYFDKFVLDNKNNKIFMNSETQEGFWVNEDVLIPTKFSFNVTDVAVDQEYTAYVSSHTALYYFDNKKYELVKVADIEGIDRMTLANKGVPIYVSNGKLRRVSPAHVHCREYIGPPIHK